MRYFPFNKVLIFYLTILVYRVLTNVFWKETFKSSRHLEKGVLLSMFVEYHAIKSYSLPTRPHMRLEFTKFLHNSYLFQSQIKFYSVIKENVP